MFEAHPSPEEFESFLRGTSRFVPSTPSGQHVMRHLLQGCDICRHQLSSMGWSQERLSHLLQPVSAKMHNEEQLAVPTAGSYDYDRAFAAAELAVSSFLAPEQAPTISPVQLIDELSNLPANEQIERVSAGGPYAFPEIIRGLVERSHVVRYRDANEMLRFARLAKVAADACSTAAAGDEMKLSDLRARAWGQYGTALRVSGQPREAEEALFAAQTFRKHGTGDPALRAWLLERIAAFAIFQGRFEDAIEACDEAGQVYQDLGDSHLFAVTLTQKAIALLYSGEAEPAVRILNQGIPLIDFEEDPHLLLAACHNLIRCYIDLDCPDQALTLYNETRSLYQEFDDPLILLRTAWQEGQLLRDLGHLRAAETVLLRARKGYMEKGLAYEVALVSLDLAAVYVKLGLPTEVKKTVMTTVPIFHALRVKLETLAALLQLQQVADQEQQAMELIRTLHTRIEPLRRPSVDSQ